MRYERLTEKELDAVVTKYVEYYNGEENGCWTFRNAYKRIHQIMTIEDSLCLVQYGDGGALTGFCIGYFKQFDDLLAYYLEEIVIFTGYHGRGYGTDLLAEIERIVRAQDATHIELVSVNDAHHLHFYEKSGYYQATNLALMGKHFDE
ncbi:MAG: GNAT family N-acetyltransferase [Clostridia bacterium]|nr:GNAT family N-acetyltransferase [Clostridia bacterium]